MIISLIVAMDEDRGIGVGGGLPWRLSSDLKRFKALTMGHHLMMGRKTYESIGRPLPGRVMIVVTRNTGFKTEGVLIAHSVEEGVEIARGGGDSELFVIGGGEIFEQALPLAHRIYITRVHTKSEADTYFPEIDLSDWWVVDSLYSPVQEGDEFSYTFEHLETKH